MNIDAKTVVTMHYRLKDGQGQLVEESFGAEPMLYLHGADNLVAGLERELDGKQAGDTLSAVVSPEDGYGPYEPTMKQEVPMDAFAGIPDIAPGMRFIAETDQGPRPVIVCEIRDNFVVVDGNHPMAGKTLHFDIEVLDVRAATEKEIAQGSVLSGCGCSGNKEEKEHECCGGSGDCHNGEECCSSH